MSQLRSLCISTFMLTMISFNKMGDVGWDSIRNCSVTPQLEYTHGKGNNGLLYLVGKNGFCSGSKEMKDC